MTTETIEALRKVARANMDLADWICGSQGKQYGTALNDAYAALVSALKLEAPDKTVTPPVVKK